MNNKKGISAVVATVLIILITVAAVTIIWAAIIPMINNQLTKGTVCLDAVSQVSLSDVGYTCKHASGANVSIQVSRNAKAFDLADIQVVITAAGNSYSYNLATSPEVVVNPGFPNANEEKVYVIDTSGITGTIDKVEIAPVVKIGNAQESCDISSAKTLSVCA